MEGGATTSEASEERESGLMMGERAGGWMEMPERAKVRSLQAKPQGTRVAAIDASCRTPVLLACTAAGSVVPVDGLTSDTLLYGGSSEGGGSCQAVWVRVDNAVRAPLTMDDRTHDNLECHGSDNLILASGLLILAETTEVQHPALASRSVSWSHREWRGRPNETF